jgi:protein SCO1/2
MSVPEAQNPKPGSPSPLLLLLVLGALFAVVVVVALAFINRPAVPAAGDSQTDTGAAIVDGDAFSTGVNDIEPKPVTDRVLTRADGQPFSLSDLRGSYVLLYFGYTYCPDFCPSTMVDWRLIRRGLEGQADDVVFLMVSVDPARDTPEVLTRYLQQFDPAIVGATSDEATLRAMADEFGAFFEAVTDGDTPLYMVNHTASQFLIDPDGNFVTVYTFGTPIDIVTEDLRAKLSE